MKITKSVAGLLSAAYDSLVCRPASVARQARNSPSKRGSGKGFAVVIPHYNRGRSIHRPLFNLLDYPAVEEIIVLDDGSSFEEFDLLCRNVRSLDPARRIRIERREENRGALATKIEAVAAAKSEWVLILDSDNTAFKNYLRELQNLPQRDPNTIYCSPFAFPFFSFRPLAGRKLDFDDCCALTRTGELRKVFIINDGNYLVHRGTFLDRASLLKGLRSDVADVMVTNYKWLSEGGIIEILERGTYHHRVDASSFWMRTADESRSRVMFLFQQFEDGRRFGQWEEVPEELAFA